MVRGKFVYSDNKLIPIAEYKPKAPEVHHIIVDEIPAQQHPANGEWVTSKHRFNEITRAYGYESVSPNESDKTWEEDKTDKDADIHEDVMKAMAQLSYGEALTQEEREKCKLMDKREDWEAEK